MICKVDKKWNERSIASFILLSKVLERLRKTQNPSGRIFGLRTGILLRSVPKSKHLLTTRDDNFGTLISEVA